MPIPLTMRALQLESFDGPDGLHIREVPTPTPGAGQVLVKMHTAAVNPSDLMFMRNQYGIQRTLPTTLGFEGCGTVVATGSGLGVLWLGRRVALATQAYGGTWSEYTIASATNVFPLKHHISDAQGAMLMVNPLTAWALIDEARRMRQRAIVLNAANSALGRMLIRIATLRGLASIAIVRNAAYVRELRNLGATEVLVSSDPDFFSHLAHACTHYQAGIGFDAVAGELTGVMLKAMPARARVLVYGALSSASVDVDVSTLLFGTKVVEGFWLTEWIHRRGMVQVIRAMRDIQNALYPAMTTEVTATYPLETAVAGIRAYEEQMGTGKIVLQFHG
ncbi:MAG: alcohol dehydrogenase catalytic domain-containing protein [Chloroflexota bacterium]